MFADNNTRALLLVFSFLLGIFSATAQEKLDPINIAPGARTWHWSEAGISVRLTHIVPDQLRGFFQARGFKPDDTELIANACVFQTVIRNDTPASVVKVDLKNWLIISTAAENRVVRVRETWEPIWTQRQVPLPARLAFHWALFPTVQLFHQGDWNMGMSSYGLPPGAKFDLQFSFLVDGKQRRGTIREIECASGAKRQ